jgi:uncharacterized protein (TIGR02001 family)
MHFLQMMILETTMTKKVCAYLSAGVIASGLMLGTAAQAESSLPGSISGNVAITSDYIFRGISQSDENVAIQGGLDWDAGNGFYLGVWASSINFNDGDEASIEVDYVGGYAGENGNFSYDVGFTYYTYPGADDSLDYDFFEVGVGVGYAFEKASVSGGVYYTEDNFGATDEAIYSTAGIEVPLNDAFTASANYSHYSLEPSFGPDYNTWDIGVTYSFEWFDIDARYYDVDEDAYGDIGDGRAVLTISRSF